MYVKQPQNILSNHKILKIKMKEHEVEKKKEYWKKVEWNIYCPYFVC